jgi:hypothetical protein
VVFILQLWSKQFFIGIHCTSQSNIMNVKLFVLALDIIRQQQRIQTENNYNEISLLFLKRCVN